MSIKNNKNNKNICLVYIYMEILEDKNYIIICMCFTAETIIICTFKWLH